MRGFYRRHFRETEHGVRLGELDKGGPLETRPAAGPKCAHRAYLWLPHGPAFLVDSRPVNPTFCASAVLLLAACSCSRDDGAAPVPKDALVGRWQTVSVTESAYGADGRLLRRATSTYAPGSSVEYTDREVLLYQGAQISHRTVYARQDSVLHTGYGTAPGNYQTIRKLDARQLVLVSRRVNNSAGEQTDVTLVHAR